MTQELLTQKLAESIAAVKNPTILQQDTIFMEDVYPGISELIKDKINKLLEQKESLWIPKALYYKIQSTQWVQSYIKSLLSEIELDYDNLGLKKSDNILLDIPAQAKQANIHKVPQEYNATVWMLIDENNDILAHPHIISTLKNNFWIDMTSQNILNDLLKYQPGDWMPTWRKTLELLIQVEEKKYNWKKTNTHSSQVFYIPGWAWWLTLFRDYFLSEWELVVVPNLRWWNIDSIVTNKTKIPPVACEMITKDGNISWNHLENILDVARQQRRKKVSMYLNFPNNPTGIKANTQDIEKLNQICHDFNDIQIQIVLDDPYGAFSYESNWNISQPISYDIDTLNNKNVTVVEIWSHGTKEMWIYGIRTAVLRVFSHPEKIASHEQKISAAIRSTFSMSHSLSQVIMVKAILWNDVDAFDINHINDLSVEQIEDRLSRYLEKRKYTHDYIQEKKQKLASAMEKYNGDFLQPVQTTDNQKLWWFFTCYRLTQSWINKKIDIDALRKICISQETDKKCWFAVFQDTIDKTQYLRISIVAGNLDEYAYRISQWIQKLLSQ